jgi:hypothetical protein
MPSIDPDWGIGLAHHDEVLTGWDVTVLKLVMHRTAPGIVLEMSRQGRRVVVDVDDFHHGLHGENVAAAMTDPYRNADVNRAWYEQVIRVADTVTVSTEFLANYYEPRCRDVRLIRNGVDAERYPVRDVSGEPVVGWVGATPWRSGDIETLAGWLPRMVRDTGLRVHHAGAISNDPYPFPLRAGLREGDVTTEGMRPLTRYPEMFGGFNIGIVPLNLIPFNEAKSTIKGLEYGASGIPFIAAPSAEYVRLAAKGVGRVAYTPDEWRGHVEELSDEATRVAEGERIRELVEAFHTYESRGDQWATALSG